VKIYPDLTLAGARQALHRGIISPASLLDRICNELEKKEPQIQAFLPEPDRRKRLHSDLKKLHLQYPEPGLRPPLFGIPVGVKDLYQVNGFPTRAGSKLPPQVFHGQEALAVSRLKAAGALILGKTVTTEFAYFEAGPTRNPLNPDHTPGGSSSGSAAAVAAGYCPLSLGTQTIGSVIRPAAYCGIIGFKPSQRRMSIEGTIPFSPTVDQAGFFVNDLESLSIAANILVDNWQENQNDNQQLITLAIPGGKYLEQCDTDIITAFREDIADLVEKGVRIKTIPLWDDIKEINRLHNELIAREFYEVHRTWYRHYSKLYSLRSADLIATGKRITETAVSQALDLRETVRNRIRQVMETHIIDAFISPATSTFAPLGLDSTGSPIMNLPWTFAGVPAISIPGTVNQEGLISGLQLTAFLNQDEKLIQLANILKNS
jgi:Asp-tRNA(Asn)/Glu-tRNA(Gln) amidotransferase A subunit family amidase